MRAWEGEGKWSEWRVNKVNKLLRHFLSRCAGACRRTTICLMAKYKWEMQLTIPVPIITFDALLLPLLHTRASRTFNCNAIAYDMYCPCSFAIEKWNLGWPHKHKEAGVISILPTFSNLCFRSPWKGLQWRIVTEVRALGASQIIADRRRVLMGKGT